MNFQPHHKRTLIHAVLFIIAIGFSVMANAQGHVVFKGRVLRTDVNSPAVSMIVTDGIDTMDVMIGRHGQYNFAIPTNETVRVILSSENYITKVIELNTHNAPEAKGPLARPEHVEFFVELERQSKAHPMMYSGLAGSIYFTPQDDGVRTMLVPTPQAKSSLATNTVTADL